VTLATCDPLHRELYVSHHLERLHIVVLSTVLPVPQDGGQRRRAHELLVRLAHDHDISWLCSSRRFREDVALAPTLSALTRRVIVRAAAEQVRATVPSSDRRGGGLRALRRQLALPAPPASPYVPSVPQHVAASLSRDLAADLKRLLASERVDLIQADAALLPHLPADLTVPLVVVEHPVHSDLWDQRVEAAVDADEARQCARQAVAARRYEQATWRRAKAIVTVTQEDTEQLFERLPGLDVRLVPNGYDHDPDLALPAGDSRVLGADASAVVEGHPTVVYAADLTNPVSADTALVLSRDVLPKVQNLIPGAMLVLAGPLPPGGLPFLKREGVLMPGRLSSFAPLLSRADVVAIPARVAEGSSVPVLEALHAGRAVVASSPALRGLSSNAREAVVTCEEPQTFAAAVARLLKDKRAREAQQQLAGRATQGLPTWSEAAMLLDKVWQEVARGEAGEAAEAAQAGELPDAAQAGVNTRLATAEVGLPAA